MLPVLLLAALRGLELSKIHNRIRDKTTTTVPWQFCAILLIFIFALREHLGWN